MSQPKQNAASAVNQARAKQEFEKRQVNTKGIITAFIIMLLVAVADTLWVLDAIKLLFSFSPWAVEIAVFINVAAAMIFIGAATFGMWAARQNS